MPWHRVGVSVVILLLALAFRRLFSRYILRFTLRFTSKTKTQLDDELLRAFQAPLGWLIVAIGLYFALMALGFNAAATQAFGRILQSVFIVVVATGLYKVAYLFTNLGTRFRLQFDRIVKPFLTRLLRFIIVASAVAMIADIWGFNVGTFVAGLGIGGLALALAAKDSLANLFAGFVIITERPFSIDDWIKTPSVQGTVEDITFRSTKVRTFAQALVIVPNSLLANEPITNWTKMGKRQVSFQLGVTYSTSRDKLEEVVKAIRNLLQNHPGVHPETIMVAFDTYGSSSLDIFLYFFTKTTVWAEYLVVKEDINFKIMEILEELDVQVAFPSQSVYFETPLHTNQSQPEAAGHEENQENTGHTQVESEQHSRRDPVFSSPSDSPQSPGKAPQTANSDALHSEEAAASRTRMSRSRSGDETDHHEPDKNTSSSK
ncbi:mechanosensitive ion channel [Alicyclobacillus sp. SO9]|nr:mechanosensitive ion channel [Alicyclobacillus sp. SO9]